MKIVQMPLKIKNLKLKIPALQVGYTLVEILVVVSLLATVGLIIAIVLYSSLRGGEKTNLIERIKQNGNYAISVFSREARFASVFDGVSSDGAAYTTTCTLGTKYPYIRFQDGSGQKNTFICSGSSLTVSRAGVIDTLINASQVGIVPGSCGFTCSNATTIGTYTVGFSFSLTDPLSAAPSTAPRTPLFEKTIVNPVLFETSVTLRNTGN